MKIYKPNFWDKKKSIISIILIPLSIIYNFLLFLKTKLIKSENFQVPIICIGNIYVGGTGKTPLAMEMYKIFKEKKYNPTIIKKFYINHLDEQEMIKENNLVLISSKNRKKGIYDAIKEKYNLIILDDGFQDLSINKSLNILCFKSTKLLGNGRLLPAGPLREKIESLKKVQIIMINGNINKEFENKILSINKNIKIYYSKYVPLNLENFKFKKVVAFSGIGEPNNFYQLLERNNVQIKKKFTFPDHYNFKEREIKEIVNYAEKNNFILITTEKDYYRIIKKYRKKISYLKLKIDIENKKRFVQDIMEYIK